MFVIDTNVLSEIMKPTDVRDSNVTAWLQSHTIEQLFTTTVTLGEILAGFEILPAGSRRTEKREAAHLLFTTVFPNRVLQFDEPAAHAFAEIMTQRRKDRRTIDALDIQIAAIARSRRMSVVTRNVHDFEGSGVDIVDPWRASDNQAPA